MVPPVGFEPTTKRLRVFCSTNWAKEAINKIKALKAFPSLRGASVIELDTVYGSDKFVLKHIDSAMVQAKKICESFIPYISEETESKDGN